jgi:TonB family protein
MRYVMKYYSAYFFYFLWRIDMKKKLLLSLLFLLPLFIYAQPSIVAQVQPQYPVDVNWNIVSTDTVIVAMHIDVTGNVLQARIIRSKFHIFDNAALNAARQWKFTMYPRRTEVSYSFIFSYIGYLQWIEENEKPLQ